MYSKIIYILGMPRSGTSWLSQIFDSSPETRLRLAPLFSYAFKNRVSEHSTRAEWAAFFHDVYLSDDAFISQENQRMSGQYPTFPIKASNPPFMVIKDTRNHQLTPTMLERFSDITVVAIVRNPCGVINSWLKSSREFPGTADPMQEWKTGQCRKTSPGEYWGFDDWIEVTKLYMRLAKEHPSRVLITRHEDMIDSPRIETQRIFEFAGIACTEQTEDFLKQCHSRHDHDDYSVFKDRRVKNSWRTELDSTIIAAIHTELAGTELDVFLS